jgi:hypothetical protein
LITTPDKDITTKKGKMKRKKENEKNRNKYTNISNDRRCKNSKQYIHKLNSTVQLKGVHQDQVIFILRTKYGLSYANQ